MMLPSRLGTVFIIVFSLPFLSYMAKGGDEIKVSQDRFNFYPSISPDGKNIVYLHMIDEDDGAVGTLWLYSFETGRRHQLCTLEQYEQYDSEPVWMHDSKSVIFSSGSTIYSVDIKSRKSEELLTTETEGVSLFAPSLSPDGQKIAFWVLFSVNDSSYQSVWVWDMRQENIVRLPDAAFGPQTEVTWFLPQWVDNHRIAATFYPPSEFVAHCYLNIIDLNTNEMETISDGLYSSYFRVLGEKLYYTKKINGKVRLLCYGLQKKYENTLIRDLNGVFDVFEGNKGINIVFARDDLLYLLKGGKIEPLGFSGSNPKFMNGFLIYEKWGDADSMANSLFVKKMTF